MPVPVRTALPLIGSLLLFLTGCDSQNGQAGGGEFSAAGKSSDLVYHTIMDDKTNIAISRLPLPSTWKIQKKGDPDSPTILGPKGLKIFVIPYQSFTYTEDPLMLQVYQQTGQTSRWMPEIEKLIEEDFVPWAANLGLKFVKSYPLPGVARVDKNYNDQLYKVGPTTNSYGVAGTEWVNQQGDLSLIVIHYSASAADGTVYWGYYGNAMEAQPGYFEEAKAALIHGLENVQYNREHIQVYNQKEQQKAQASMAAHQRKMQNNQARFEAQQSAFRERSNAINNSIMSNWRSQNAASDRSHDQYINSIRDVDIVTNPTNGQSYEVESGANQYWMNNNGEYIKSDNYLYDPNLDQGVNQNDWQQAPVN